MIDGNKIKEGDENIRKRETQVTVGGNIIYFLKIMTYSFYCFQIFSVNMSETSFVEIRFMRRLKCKNKLEI